MKIFELHFNPRQKSKTSDLLFDSFCYEPKNIYEKKLGNLYIVGEIKNLLPKNINLLDNLSRIIKEEFYSNSKNNQKKNFESSLKKANEFLAEELLKENVSWLGNLNFSSISLTSNNAINPHKRWWKISFTKTGTIKVLLLRDNKITDLTKNLDFEEIEPYPLKVFVKTVTGRLIFGDKIIILTKNIFDFLETKKLLDEFAKNIFLSEQKIKEILKKENSEINKISGVLLFVDTEQNQSKSSTIVTFKKELEKFSLKQVFSPFLNLISPLPSFFKNVINFFSKKKNQLKKQKISNIKIVKSKKLLSEKFKNSTTLIIAFLILTLIGSFVFQKQEKKESKEVKESFERIQEKITEAESYLNFKNEEKANILFLEALEEIQPLTQEKGAIKEEAMILKNYTEENLKKIHKLEKISEEKVIVEFNSTEFIPQKIVYLKENLYFFNNTGFSNKLYKFNIETKNQENFSFSENINIAINSNDSILFFSKPNELITFNKNNEFLETIILESPYDNSDFISISFYQNNIYLLDKESKNIIRYSYPLTINKKFPQLWLSSQTKKNKNSKSITIDSFVWILDEDNSISKYYMGQHQEDLIINIFPYPKKFSKILTLPGVPYLYILEPTQNRIIVLDKKGGIFKQFEVEETENIKDFTISDDGKTIYLLSNQKTYEINL